MSDSEAVIKCEVMEQEEALEEDVQQGQDEEAEAAQLAQEDSVEEAAEVKAEVVEAESDEDLVQSEEVTGEEPEVPGMEEDVAIPQPEVTVQAPERESEVMTSGDVEDAASERMSRDEPKLLVRQINFKSTEETLQEYFTQYGEVREVQLKKNHDGTSRGFGFIVFSDPAHIDLALEVAEHKIDDKVVICSRAKSLSDKMKTRKLFIGGLPAALSEENLREYFEKYGPIDNFQFVMNKQTNIRKAFCFIEFRDEETVEKITEGKIPPNSVVHTIEGQTVDCKKKFDDDHPIQKKLRQNSTRYNDNGYRQGYGYDQSAYGQYDYSQYGAYAGYGAYGYDQSAAYGAYGYPAYPGYGYGYGYPPAAYGAANYGPVKPSSTRGSSSHSASYKPY